MIVCCLHVFAMYTVYTIYGKKVTYFALPSHYRMSLETYEQILSILSESTEPLGAAEIAQTLGFHSAKSVFPTLYKLVREQKVIKVTEGSNVTWTLNGTGQSNPVSNDCETSSTQSIVKPEPLNDGYADHLSLKNQDHNNHHGNANLEQTRGPPKLEPMLSYEECPEQVVVTEIKTELSPLDVKTEVLEPIDSNFQDFLTKTGCWTRRAAQTTRSRRWSCPCAVRSRQPWRRPRLTCRRLPPS